MGSSANLLTQLLVLLLFPLHVLPTHPSNGIILDRSALLAFKRGIAVDPDHALANWNETTSPCEWTGIACSTNPERVTQLDLKSRYLEGTISPFLSNLSCLKLLELSDNSLQGSIPEDLGALSSLELFGIQGNGIQHKVPDSFSRLMKLRYIDLSNNQLGGRLPNALFSNCTQLGYVDLSNNWFNGTIPLEIGNHLLHLENLLLYLNQLTGTIPPSLANSTEMEEIDLENNFLSGTLPSTFLMNMLSLKRLHLSYNNFSSEDDNSNLAPFFGSISNLTHLEELELAGNGLGGTFPQTIGLLRVNLSQLYLQDNLLHGAIPPEISNLTNLMSLNLSNNLLNGTIPLELILLPNLQGLWLSNNLLCGEIPSLPYVLHSLGLLDLSRNNLSGAIPSSLENLSELRTLILNGNLLSGSIPSTLGNTKLELLDLSHNMLTGTIPAEVARLSTIARYFNLSHNLLGGTLPMELSKMDKVQAIDLSHNRLQGSVPGSLGSLLNLQFLDLSYNQFSGEIPSSLQKCTSLRQLDLSCNNFSGPLPQGGLFDFLTSESIKGNHFCGSSHGLHTCLSGKRSMTHSHKPLVLLVSLVSISAFFLTIICVISYKKIRNRLIRSNGGSASESALDLSLNYPRITYRELEEATGGFDRSRLIGSGSFGDVYRGMLIDGSVVAIKVLQLQAGNYTRSFNRECQVLKRIRHRNLIRIITACSHPEFKALVLPFMANGSLESHLYPKAGHSGFSLLSLIERVNICSDIAEGMAYLHHHSPVQVIHCDLKPSNVLLNDDMTALVADFGIARLVMNAAEGSTIAENNANSTANLLCGSIGYVAPEYGYGRSASTKGDVYSFGILVLEMVTRRRPTDEMFSEGPSLQKWVKNQYYSQLEKVVDSYLMQNLRDQSPQVQQMWEVATLELLELGLLCTLDAPSTRPTMLDVADDLDRLKRYLGGDTTATFTSSRGVSSSTISRGDYW